jgi:hypothetical protein
MDYMAGMMNKKIFLGNIDDLVYLCDTFEGIVKVDSTKDLVYKKYDDYGNEQCDGITKMVEEERNHIG